MWILRSPSRVIRRFAKALYWYVAGVAAYFIKDDFYKFTLEDISLYIKERCQPLYKIEIKTDQNEFRRITIGDVSIFWPYDISERDLPWLYHEVFDDFRDNPSSYDHHAFPFESLNWVVDAGAAEGYFTLFSARKTRDNGRIFALEPLSIMLPCLEQTVQYNKCKNVKVARVALGDIDGYASIKLDTAHICDSKILIQDSVGQIDKDVESVRIARLDTLFSEWKLSGLGLIKMDIEGYEMNALTGAVSLLRDSKPYLAIAVYHEYENAVRCAEIIRSANPSYKIEFRGRYGYFKPPRPYLLFAY